MTAVALGRFTPGTEEWTEARRLRIGGSEIAAVLGLSPFDSPYSLWHRKASDVVTFDGNRFTEWGTRLEPVVGAKFCEGPGRNPRMPELQGKTFVHPDRDWQSASPDVLLYDPEDTFVEVKTAARGDAWWDGVPVYYRCQVLWTMDVLGVDHAWLAALIGGSDYREYRIEMDEDAEADLAVMRDAGQKFIDSLIDGTPPDIDDSYATWQTVQRLHPDIDHGTEYPIDRDLAEAFISATADLDAAKRAQQLARTDIARHMGRAHYAVCEGVRIARRQPARDDGPPFLVATRKSLPLQESAA